MSPLPGLCWWLLKWAPTPRVWADTPHWTAVHGVPSSSPGSDPSSGPPWACSPAPRGVSAWTVKAGEEEARVHAFVPACPPLSRRSVPTVAWPSSRLFVVCVGLSAGHG